MKNWKTTLCGLISGAAAFMTLNPAAFPDMAILVAKFIAAGGLAGVGIFSKDSNVTGGKVRQ